MSAFLHTGGAGKPHSMALAIAAALLLISGATLADDSDATLKTVSVSAAPGTIAEAREQSTLGNLSVDLPVAGSILQRDEIEAVAAVSSLHELLKRVPGVGKVRNMRISDGSKNYTDNRVDGLRVSPTGTYTFVDETNMNDIERIEFINGPGSVLQSSHAIGGTINVITRMPPREKELRLSQELGGYSFSRTDVSAGGTLGNGFAYLLDANILRDDGWRDRSSEDKDAFSVKLGGRPDNRSTLYFRLEYLKDDALYPGQLTEAQFKENWQQAQPGVYGRGMDTIVTPSLHYKRLVGEKGEFSFSAARRTVDTTTYGNTATYTSFSNKIGLSRDKVTSAQALYRQDFDLAASRLYLGIEGLKSESDSKSYNNALPVAQGLLGNFVQGTLITTSGNSLTTETSWTPFVNLEFSPLSQLRLHMGVRADDIHYVADDRTTKNKDGEASFRKLVPKAGATWEFNPRQLMWASYAGGFLAPSVSTLLGSGVVGNTTNTGGNGYIPAADLLPEEMKTFELGFRGTLPKRALRYDVTFYRTEIRNMVLQRDCTAAEQASIGCYRMNENVGQMTAKGIETSLSQAVRPWLDIALSHTLVFTEFGYYKSATVDYTGNDYYSTPRHHLNARFSFKPAPGWEAELEGDYESSYFLDHANTQTYQRPVLWNLRTRYTDPGKRWSAWLHLLNLGDVQYGARLGLSGTTRTYTDGYMPLTLRAGVSYKF